jgi:hypothetical protein
MKFTLNPIFKHPGGSKHDGLMQQTTLRAPAWSVQWAPGFVGFMDGSTEKPYVLWKVYCKAVLWMEYALETYFLFMQSMILSCKFPLKPISKQSNDWKTNKSESVDVRWNSLQRSVSFHQLQRRFLPFNWLLGSSNLPRHQQEQWQYPPGWWYTYPSEKYDFVTWDDYSQYMEK